jgi:hypothetical protein
MEVIFPEQKRETPPLIAIAIWDLMDVRLSRPPSPNLYKLCGREQTLFPPRLRLNEVYLFKGCRLVIDKTIRLRSIIVIVAR